MSCLSKWRGVKPAAVCAAVAVCFLLVHRPARAQPTAEPAAAGRLRVIVETDAGGDPDDEQSLVRFLLYCNEWDVEGIVANREQARDGENLNPVRDGLGIVRAMLDAYGQCRPNLVRHDPRYPTKQHLWDRTVSGYAGVDDGVRLIVAAVDSPDPRPVWYCNWGTDSGSAESSLKRALNVVLRERGPAGYERFKGRLRLSSDDAFGEHTFDRAPPWKIWVDTFWPERDRKRWYHRFSALTAKAGGFDVERDVRTGHGPLGALYPTNTTHPQKEGDSMSFLYLVPTGMNNVDQPTWGSWAGRYGPRDEKRPGYYWANVEDAWNGTTTRDNTLARWAAHLQNDFRARLDWCVKDYAGANHPPAPALAGAAARVAKSGERVELEAAGTRDPDGNPLEYEWVYYPEPGTYRGPAPAIEDARTATAAFRAPATKEPASVHVILLVTDRGSPPLTRYRRVVVNVRP